VLLLLEDMCSLLCYVCVLFGWLRAHLPVMCLGIFDVGLLRCWSFPCLGVVWKLFGHCLACVWTLFGECLLYMVLVFPLSSAFVVDMFVSSMTSGYLLSFLFICLFDQITKATIGTQAPTYITICICIYIYIYTHRFRSLCMQMEKTFR